MPGDLIQTPQTRWIQGAYESVQRGTPIILLGTVNNGVGESRYSRLMQAGAASGYVVTAGKTLYITSISFATNLATSTWALGSGTADAGDNQVAAPAGMQSETSDADGKRSPWYATTTATAFNIDTLIPIAAGRYPNIRFLNASAILSVLCLGHEE